MDTLTFLEKLLKYFAFFPFIASVIALLSLIYKKKNNLKKKYVLLYGLITLILFLFALFVWHTYSK